MINLEIHPRIRDGNVKRCRERNVLLPTFSQMRDPDRVPEEIRERLTQVGLWDVDPANLFRITWKNEPKETGGTFGGVNAIELPSELTGVPARIVALIGTGSRPGPTRWGRPSAALRRGLVSGNFDSLRQKAVWPSTGNYCRGGAYNSALLGCDSIAILPEGMSRERFEWLKRIAGEVIPTPGSESNVKEIFDACHRICAASAAMTS